MPSRPKELQDLLAAVKRQSQELDRIKLRAEELLNTGQQPPAARSRRPQRKPRPRKP